MDKDLKKLAIRPGAVVNLAKLDASDTGGLTKEEAEQELLEHTQAIADLQMLLYAEKKSALLVVFQGMDTSGKDGAIRKVFGRVNPMGVNGVAFGAPSHNELLHDFLWRIHKELPRKGGITLFNRSHYEDIVAVRVRKLLPKKVWEARYEQINAFEALADANNIRTLKLFLHITKTEQGRRLQARLDNPAKQWKLQQSDLDDRKLWSQFQHAYQDVLSRCSTKFAPWHVVPANKKWFRDVIVARLVRASLEELAPKTPSATLDPTKVVIPH